MKHLTVSLLLMGICGTVFGAAAPCPETPATVKTLEFQGKRLNNVVRSLDFACQSTGQNLTASFNVPDAGWTFVEFNRPVQKLQLLKDGIVCADDSAMVRQKEFMLDLAAGNYTITAQGADNLPGDAPAIKRIHRIPEIYYYTPGVIPGMEVLDGDNHWEMLGDQLLGATNLLAPGSLTPEQLALYRQAGRKVFFNAASVHVSANRLQDFKTSVQKGLDDPTYDGYTVDEFDFNNPASYARYREALAMLNNPLGKRMYTWSYSVKFTGKKGQLDFVKLCAAPPSGKGRLMTEVYLETKETEEDAKNFIEQRVVKDAASILQRMPEMAPYYGIVPGNFNCMPILTQETVPEVDYKYYLDWQLNVIANNPACKDLGLVGYWGGNYCQEELQRWCLALLRHYFVDGKTTMLSDEYGYKYRPGILQNGDFLRDLKHWSVFAAEKDSIRQDSVKGHGYLMQCRWGKTTAAEGGVYNGDAAAVMTRSANGVNILQQEMKNLIPGQPYILHFVVGSFDDAKNKVFNPRDYGIRAEFVRSEAAVRHEAIYVDRREKHRYRSEKNFSRANVIRVIFVPSQPTVTLNITDRASSEKPGTQLMVNFVQVKPYYARELMK